MIRPDDRPWFVPYKPESPDYQKLLDTIARNDANSEAIGTEAMVEQLTGASFDNVMMASVHEAVTVAVACGHGAPAVAVRVGAWMTGFTAGLRKARGVELPENPPDDPKEMMKLMFGDIDPDSLAFLAFERSDTLVSLKEHEAILDPTVAELATVSSLWLDGLVTGLAFDGGA